MTQTGVNSLRVYIYRFLREDTDSSQNKDNENEGGVGAGAGASPSARKKAWEDQLAEKYYESLYREFAVCDLKHYKSGNVRHPLFFFLLHSKKKKTPNDLVRITLAHRNRGTFRSR